MSVSTLNDLIRHIGLEVGLDQNNGSDEWSLMMDWAQDAVYDFLIRTRSRLTSTTLALSAGVKDYSMASLGVSILEITDMFLTSGGNVYDLERVTIEEILDWRRTSQANDRVRLYAVEGDLLAVYPTPASADVITAYVVTKPTALVSGLNDFTTVTYGGIPIQHSPVLLAYMRYRASIYDERKVPHTPDQYRQMYDILVMEAKRRMRNMGGRARPGMDASYPGTGGNPGTRNDRYPEE